MSRTSPIVTASSTFVAANGDGYERQMGRWSRRLAPLFVKFIGITHTAHVLDVGCGTGNLSFCIAQNPEVVSVRGIDLSPAYVDHAKRRSHDARLTFQVGDACSLPFPDEAFDLTASMLTLQFIPQCEFAVREMHRVTQPGGTVAAATWDTRGGYVAYRMFFDTAAMCVPNGNERRAHAYTRPMSRPGDLARTWRDAGLAEVEQDMLTIRMDFTCFTDFWAPAEGGDGPIAEYVRTLDAPTRTKLKDMVALAYLDGEADGARSYAATAWVVKGKAVKSPI